MKLALVIFVLFAQRATAYVPTVESLFRHGGNPDLVTNGVSLTLRVKKILPGAEKENESPQDELLVKDSRKEDFFKIFFTKGSGENYKIAQTRYSNNTFSESSLEHKIYYSNFTPYTIKADVDHLEKGIFYGLIYSVALNNGAFLINYLKSLGVPLRLNSEIINREKVELLASYKRYLVMSNKDKSIKKNDENPLRPEDSAARDKVERIMEGPMYVNTGNVKLAKENMELLWLISSEAFEAQISYKERQIEKIKYKTMAGEFEIVCKDYWLGNGTHSVPRFINLKNLKGESYSIEVINLRHYAEKDEDLLNRLKKWDELLKGKETTDSRPEFLL